MSADVWSLVESSKPKRIDRWEIPTRWRVKYAPCPTFEGMTYWAVLAPGAVVPVARFRTWRETQDYADRQARTREVVLPRPQFNKDGKVEFDFTEWAGLNYEPALGDKAVYELRTGPGPRFGERDVLIPREHWKPLANALHALAEQEESCGR